MKFTAWIRKRILKIGAPGEILENMNKKKLPCMENPTFATFHEDAADGGPAILHEVVLTNTMSGEPLVLHTKSNRAYKLTWRDIISFAVDKGLVDF